MLKYKIESGKLAGSVIVKCLDAWMFRSEVRKLIISKNEGENFPSALLPNFVFHTGITQPTYEQIQHLPTMSKFYCQWNARWKLDYGNSICVQIVWRPSNFWGRKRPPMPGNMQKKFSFFKKTIFVMQVPLNSRYFHSHQQPQSTFFPQGGKPRLRWRESITYK
jgi:hypothetical protein